MKLVNGALFTLVTIMVTACNQSTSIAAQPQEYTHGECYYDFELDERVCEPSSSESTNGCSEGTTLVKIGYDEQCMDIYSQNTCLLKQNGFSQALQQNNSEHFESCLLFQNQNYDSNKLMSSPLQISFGENTQALKKAFAEWADQNTETLTNLYFWQTPTQFGENYTLGGKLNSQSAIAILKPFQLPHETVNYINFYPAPKYFAQVEDLDHFIFNSDQKSLMENSHLFPSEGQKLYSIYRELDLNQVETTLSKTERGCKDSCLQYSPIYRMQDHFVQVKTYSIGEQEYRKDLILLDAQGAIKGSLYLVGNQISLYIQINRNSLGLPTKVQIFNRLSKKVFDKSYQAISQTKVNAERQNFSNYPYKDIHIGVCEDNINPKNMRKIGFNKNILMGPNLHFSYYGWQNQKGSPQDYWQGRKQLNDLQLPHNYFSLEQHATDTIGTLLKFRDNPGKIGILPLGLEHCLHAHKVKTWFDTVERYSKLRVINYSASERMSKKSCEEIAETNPLLKKQDKYLWIVAAGNQGSYKPLACPQHLSGRKNILVVGAESNGFGAERSNRGRFVDLITEGNSLVSGAWGTSFATPRVSRVAAEIFNLAPSLTPIQVKAILLVTAKDSRFNAHKALELAKAYAKKGSFSKAFDTVYQDWCVTWNCSPESTIKLRKFNKILRGER